MKTTDFRTAQREYDARLPDEEPEFPKEKPEGKRIGTRRIGSARKPHQCAHCGATIFRGDSYTIAAYKWIESVVSFSYCEQCEDRKNSEV